MVYRAAVKTGVIFEAAKNKKRAKEFVAFLLQDENLQPYVEGSLGRWFPVTKSGTQSAFWQADPHRKAVFNQFGAGTVTSSSRRTTSSRPQQRERLGEGDEPRGQRQCHGRKGRSTR